MKMSSQKIKRARELWREVQFRITTAINKYAKPSRGSPLPLTPTHLHLKRRSDLQAELTLFEVQLNAVSDVPYSLPCWAGMLPPADLCPCCGVDAIWQFVDEPLVPFSFTVKEWDSLRPKYMEAIANSEKWFLAFLPATNKAIKPKQKGTADRDAAWLNEFEKQHGAYKEKDGDAVTVFAEHKKKNRSTVSKALKRAYLARESSRR